MLAVTTARPYGAALGGDTHDLPDRLLAFRTILEDLGENVVLANSGEDALRRLLECEFAVVLLDVNMPGLDGFETAELLLGSILS